MFPEDNSLSGPVSPQKPQDLQESSTISVTPLGAVPPSVTPDFILENRELMQSVVDVRGIALDINALADSIERRRELTHQVDSIRSELKHGQGGPDISEQDRKALRERKAELKKLEDELTGVSGVTSKMMRWVPNLLSPEVPIGSDTANVVLRMEGQKTNFDFEPKKHFELAESLDLIDFERGSKVAGSRFYFMKNDLVLMRLGLTQLYMSHLAAQNFVPVIPPYVATEETLYGTGYYPYFEGETYHVSGETFGLIGTSEQVLIGQHINEILPPGKLPLKYVGESQCFRTEAGAAGKDTRGAYRVHQFGKVEQIIICHPQESEHYHQVALINEEWLLKQLKLPYQVILSASGDIHPLGWKKYDVEGWFPGFGAYRELTSNTNLTDGQTRRMKLRFREEDGKISYPHTISATGFSDRLLLAILENYQTRDGAVVIPEVLRDFMGGKQLIEPK